MEDEMIKVKTNLIILRRSWKVILGFVIPILLSPLLFDLHIKENLCAYVLLLMVFYWIFEPINLYITALIPVALFPLLNIATTEAVCQNYMRSASMMFFGSLVVGISLEHCNLHHRIALKVVLLFGSSIKLLMAGVMIVTMFLSMWINNTATTAMMIPIVDDILLEINRINVEEQDEENVKHQNKHHNNIITMINKQEPTITADQNHTNEDKDSGDKKEKQPQTLKMEKLRKAFLLSIAYSANIGGTATLTGTVTNLVFQDVFYDKFESSRDVSFASWFFYAFPSALLTVFSAWLLLYLFYTRIPNEPREAGQLIKESAKRKYLELGSMTFHEFAVLVLFVILAILWFLRQPEIIEGWAERITTHSHNIKDATPAILIIILMFLIPTNLHQFYSKNPPKQIERLLDWKVVDKNMSWGVIILLGGGFALAFGTKESKLNVWFGEQLGKIHLEPLVTMIILVILSGSITEMASNVATANVVLPVVSDLAIQMQVNPLMFMIPVTVSISFAFMFPVSTPPNAIVFRYLDISVFEMVKLGLLMKIMAISIQLIFINTLGAWLFNLKEFPEWANSTLTMANNNNDINSF